MAHEVLMTEDAARDLAEVYEHIAEHDSPKKANAFLKRIEEALAALGRFPHRGKHPQELLALGIKDYRETRFKPYRIIYRVKEKKVYIYCVADGRRDFAQLLHRRLVAPAGLG